MFNKVFDDMDYDTPMRYQGIFCDIETNVLTLYAFRKWLSAEWFEKALLREEFPEFDYIKDDMIILDMQHELLASLN